MPCSIVVVLNNTPKHPDADVDAGRYERGDVIAALPIDHMYSDREINNPNWKILKIEDLTIEEGGLLTEPQVSFDGTFLRKRDMKLNLNNFNAITVQQINNLLIRQVSAGRLEIINNIENKPAYQTPQENDVVVG